MGNYYYTVSSLPYLDFDAEPVITMHEFIDICHSTLTKNDFETIESVSLSELEGMESSVPIVDRWISWESSLRNELVKLRGVSLGIESDRYLKDAEINTEAPGIARSAFKMESPLAAEEAINKARWDFLNEIDVGHYFDLEKIIVYSLRLKILERKKMFTIENGDKNFQIIYENIKEAVRKA